MGAVAENMVQAPRDAGWCATDAAGDVNQKWMRLVYGDTLSLQLA